MEKKTSLSRLCGTAVGLAATISGCASTHRQEDFVKLSLQDGSLRVMAYDSDGLASVVLVTSERTETLYDKYDKRKCGEEDKRRSFSTSVPVRKGIGKKIYQVFSTDEGGEVKTGEYKFDGKSLKQEKRTNLFWTGF